MATAIDKESDACFLVYTKWKFHQTVNFPFQVVGAKKYWFCCQCAVCVWGIIYQTNFHTLYTKKGRAHGAIKMHTHDQSFPYKFSVITNNWESWEAIILTRCMMCLAVYKEKKSGLPLRDRREVKSRPIIMATFWSELGAAVNENQTLYCGEQEIILHWKVGLSSACLPHVCSHYYTIMPREELGLFGVPLSIDLRKPVYTAIFAVVI